MAGHCRCVAGTFNVNQLCFIFRNPGTMKKQNTESRRSFLKDSTTAAAGVVLAGGLHSQVARTAHAQGSDELKVALIGCGGRGSGAIVNCFNASKGVKLIAVADAFEDQAKNELKRIPEQYQSQVDVAPERIFYGLDAYKKAVATDADMVIIATPPGFRPSQYAAAIAAGKHVFMEKPCCVDAPGFRSLQETNKLADEKGLKVGVGLQRHHQKNYVETMKRIHDGQIGKLHELRAYWNGGLIWNRKRTPDMTEMQYQVHNWYHFCWLSGDNITEQHIHNLDVCNWAMNDHPVEANGMGGCEVRYDGNARGTGQIFDHHFVEFTYKDGTKMFSQCRHINGCWNQVSEAARGSLGDSDCANRISGENAWRHRGNVPNPYDQEHVDLLKAIHEDLHYNEGYYGATSSMTSVLGRAATYSGRIVKWDDLVANGTGEFPEELAWDAPAPVTKDEEGNYPIPVPGVYKPYPDA
jgi:myo-inositol 2-dehydrogenase/D-chiro-inositol 1-dehydrogenase